jgi:hypothetical protein
MLIDMKAHILFGLCLLSGSVSFVVFNYISVWFYLTFKNFGLLSN